MSGVEKKLLFINCLIYAVMAVFSYAYVDFNLTLSQNAYVLSLLNSLQQLGYFQRPLATLIFIMLMVMAFSFYALILFLLKKDKIGRKFVLISVVLNTLILIFAYPFLSSDIFNYIFDAKIIGHYHLSPYTHKALDFPEDSWIRFMRWTHRYSPYGPLWLGYSLIPTALGLGKFTITLFMFKIFIGLFHIANAYIIFKILAKVKPKLSLMGTAAYALNPLLLTEGVANVHNDVLLATLLLLSIYFIVQKKTLFFVTSTIVGIFIKYIPMLLLPWAVLHIYGPKRISLQRLIIANLLTMTIFTYAFSSFSISVPFVSAGATQIQFQPWYLFWTLPFAALITKTWLIMLTTALSLGAAFRYLPYLYYGDWSHEGTILFMRTVILLPLVLFGIYYVAVALKKRLMW